MNLWQIDHVFNRLTGNLYLLFLDLTQEKDRYKKMTRVRIVSVSLVLKNNDLLNLNEFLIKLIYLSL